MWSEEIEVVSIIAFKNFGILGIGEGQINYCLFFSFSLKLRQTWTCLNSNRKDPVERDVEDPDRGEKMTEITGKAEVEGI